MKIGYVRSTKIYDLAAQIEAVKKYGVDELYEEKAVGLRKMHLDELLKNLRAGDSLVVFSLLCLGRTMKQLVILAKDFEARGIFLISIYDNFTSPVKMLTSLAKIECEVAIEVEKTGFYKASLKGKKFGKSPVNPQIVNKALSMYESGDYLVDEIISKTGISRGSLYNYIRRQGVTKKGV